MLTSLSNDYISITVSSHGAELQSLRKGEVEYLYQKVSGYWQRQSPVLFPIVGGLLNGQYSHDGEVYPLSQHGFARDRVFDLVGQTEDSLEFMLASDGESLEVYPFPFELTIRYVLLGETLRVEYHVRNTGHAMMYFSIGGHPAFALADDISAYSLVFEKDDEFVIDRLVGGLLAFEEGYRLDNHMMRLSSELFESGALILRSMRSREVVLRHGSEVVLTFDRGSLPHFAIWREQGAPFLCLEPWQGYADSPSVSGTLAEKPGIVSLDVGEEKMYHWSVSI